MLPISDLDLTTLQQAVGKTWDVFDVCCSKSPLGDKDENLLTLGRPTVIINGYTLTYRQIAAIRCGLLTLLVDLISRSDNDNVKQFIKCVVTINRMLDDTQQSND